MSDRTASFLFLFASLGPALCLCAAAMFAGVWPVLALISMTALVVGMDRAGPLFDAPEALRGRAPRVTAAAHFAALAATLWAVGQPDHLSGWQTAALLLAAGLFAGQVSNACAHELIHRPRRIDRRLGTAIYCSLLNGQHVSAHLLVHHPHAGTDRDPNSAPLGCGAYRYMLRAARAEITDGLAAETARLRTAPKRRLHPFVIYAVGGTAALLLAFALGGLTSVGALILIAQHAQAQLLLSDYVQHYGLRRKTDPATGKPEPIGPQHSWNAPQLWSAALMMNAPRHSDHHMHPGRDFTDLRLAPDAMPTLPRSLPVMGAIALVPPLWRRIMDPRVRAWTGQSPDQSPPHPTTDPLPIQ